MQTPHSKSPVGHWVWAQPSFCVARASFIYIYIYKKNGDPFCFALLLQYICILSACPKMFYLKFRWGFRDTAFIMYCMLKCYTSPQSMTHSCSDLKTEHGVFFPPTPHTFPLPLLYSVHRWMQMKNCWSFCWRTSICSPSYVRFLLCSFPCNYTDRPRPGHIDPHAACINTHCVLATVC